MKIVVVAFLLAIQLSEAKFRSLMTGQAGPGDDDGMMPGQEKGTKGKDGKDNAMGMMEKGGGYTTGMPPVPTAGDSLTQSAFSTTEVFTKHCNGTIRMMKKKTKLGMTKGETSSTLAPIPVLCPDEPTSFPALGEATAMPMPSKGQGKNTGPPGMSGGSTVLPTTTGSGGAIELPLESFEPRSDVPSSFMGSTESRSDMPSSFIVASDVPSIVNVQSDVSTGAMKQW